MKAALPAAVLLGVVVSGAACGTARTADAYRRDTQQLLASRTSSLCHCYDDALADDAAAAGTVAVRFTVEPGSGTLTHAAIDRKRTTAPDALRHCVLRAVRGLALSPPDRNEGHALFVYEFRPPRD